ncbi:hypothetical protein [Larkinella terrae]|uniref:Uncharacterized protein n=1 Tax=Larkinella terrae TaxID=2025311 RepID=A0A7K0ELZ2_9BACT|nr:hypothetical protein [Larkinella terrae]MRS62873.1 hypothetical protein [Larkinella terrae]
MLQLVNALMYLYYSVITPKQELLELSVIAFDIEVLLDILNQYIGSGHELLYAFLLDEKGSRTHLPVEVFDGISISKQLKTIELEYQRLLSASTE